MEFNQDNIVVRLCTKGIELEGLEQLAEASIAFDETWDEATNDFEKVYSCTLCSAKPKKCC